MNRFRVSDTDSTCTFSADRSTHQLNSGLPRSGKKSGKCFFLFQVREKSGNLGLSQGNLQKVRKVREKSRNFKIFSKVMVFGNVSMSLKN